MVAWRHTEPRETDCTDRLSVCSTLAPAARTGIFCDLWEDALGGWRYGVGERTTNGISGNPRSPMRPNVIMMFLISTDVALVVYTRSVQTRQEVLWIFCRYRHASKRD
jgi:hypothetical protein